MEQLVADLESDECLAGSRGQRQKNPLFVLCNGVEGLVDGYLLIVPGFLGAVIIERLCIELITPFVNVSEGPGPEFLR